MYLLIAYIFTLFCSIIQDKPKILTVSYNKNIYCEKETEDIIELTRDMGMNGGRLMHPNNKTDRLREQLLTEGVIWKQLVLFSIPIMVGDAVSTAL